MAQRVIGPVVSEIMGREMIDPKLFPQQADPVIEAIAGDPLALVADKERPGCTPLLLYVCQILLGGQTRLPLEWVHLCLSGLFTIEGERARLQVEMLDIQAHDFADPQCVFNEEAHQELIPLADGLILSAAASPPGVGRLRFELERLRGRDRGRRRLLGALACPLARSGALAIEI